MQQPVSKWANTEPDAGLPHALLERLAQRVPVGIIDEVWLFPTRRTSVGESTVFLVAAVAVPQDHETDVAPGPRARPVGASQPELEKRRVITARYTVTRDRRGVATVQEQISEHGTAPAAAVARIVNGVLHRMDEDGEQPPRAERIERDQERWWTLLESLGGTRPPQPPASAAEQDTGSAPAASDVAQNEAPAPEADAPATGAEDAAGAPGADRCGGGGAIDGENEIGYQ